MTFAVVLKTLVLLRIPFSVLLAPVFLLALSQAQVINQSSAWWSFLILHLLVYPASNGYNSYVDRDTGSVGGIQNPPQPTIHLYYTTLALDLCAVVLAFVTCGAPFALLIVPYILASRAYSSPTIRLKKYPVLSFLVVVFFQGAYTCYAAFTGISGHFPAPDVPLFLILAACSLQIGAAYPLTQVYQHEQDRQSGIRTMSMLLGVRGTFVFSAILFGACAAAYGSYFMITGRFMHFLLLSAFFFPVLLYFLQWYRRVSANPAAASYRSTMNMSAVSAAAMITCFLLLFFLGH